MDRLCHARSQPALLRFGRPAAFPGPELTPDLQRQRDRAGVHCPLLPRAISGHLDTTEISELTAYYVFYSRTQPFIVASVRTLFGEIRPQGKSPVSIEGTYYDLNTQLSPNPSQQIALYLIQPTRSSAYVPTTLHVRTDPIYDRNGNPVPDGTQVRFVVRDSESDQIIDTVVGLTAKGVAEAELSWTRGEAVHLTCSLC